MHWANIIIFRQMASLSFPAGLTIVPKPSGGNLPAGCLDSGRGKLSGRGGYANALVLEDAAESSHCVPLEMRQVDHEVIFLQVAAHPD